MALSTSTASSDPRRVYRKEKEYLVELDSQMKDIRQQLNEQLRCLDTRMETQVSIVNELQDFFRRRAEVELDYSKNMDKLTKSLLWRQKEQKQRREQWHLFSAHSCWQHVVAQSKKKARDHAVISDIYANVITQRLNQVQEDVQRIYRRCREVGSATHEQLLKVLHELHTALKTSQVYQGECRQAETKLRYVESQRSKLEVSIAKEKLEKSKKFKLIEKEISKRKNKYNDAYLKALKARNEYMLSMDAANAAVHKYFVDDLSDLIDCMDFGFHTCVGRALLLHVSVEENMRKSIQTSIDGMQKCLGNLDSRADKQRFLEANHTAFMIPKKFDAVALKPKPEDATHELSMHEQLRDELASRHGQLQKLLTGLRIESEEVWKTLETAEKSLLEMITAKDFDTSPAFADEDNRSISSFQPKQPEQVSLKLRANRHETEDFYLTKFGEYITISNRTHRLQARQDLIEKTICEQGFQLATSPKLSTGSGSGLPGAQNPLHKPRRRRIGRTPLMGQPKLFGGSLEEYLEATNVEIPLVVKSCIRVINLYGLHHQGIFRVSGSQLEINNFKEAFERGEDPLADVTDASDINSVAGVLKLYLRELREPFFPIVFFDQFMEIAQLNSKEEFTVRIREVFQTLPRSVFVVMRYIFSFLNHLSEFSDENMMDPYNLAICFGPTLVPVPEDKDQVQYQNLVNELIKNIIIMSEDIFPCDGGALYEKYLTREPDDGEMGEAPSEPIQDECDSEICPSEDDSVFREKDISMQLFGKAEALEATAQFDFAARSARELSFKKGEALTLFSQVSGDWWRGAKDGCEGLIPDKYIMLRIRDEDRERGEPPKSISSVPEGGRPRIPSEDSGVSSSTAVSVVLGCNPPPMLADNVFRAELSDRVALVRPTKLSNPVILSDSAGENDESLLQSTLEPAPETKTPITEVPNLQGDDELERSISLATEIISNISLSSSELTLADRDERSSLADSLSLSEEVSRCNSFSSLSSMVPSDKEAEFGRNSSLGSSESLRDLNASGNMENRFGEESVRQHRRVKSGLVEAMPGVGVKLEGWGSRSLCEQKVSGNNKGSFTRKRELWEKRSYTSDSGDETNAQRLQRQWNAARSESQPQSTYPLPPQLQLQLRQKHTPDLVMDLPVLAPLTGSDDGVRMRTSSSSSLSSCPAMDSVFEPPLEPDSSNPGSPQMTAAETFAMQSQNTLKKSSTSKSIPRGESPERKSLDLGTRGPAGSKEEDKLAASANRMTISGRHLETLELKSSVVELKSFSSFGTKVGAMESPLASSTTPPRPQTPKLIAKFPNLYCTPTPVLPIANAGGVPVFDLPNADPNSQSKPQVKVKPQVLKKPTLPQMPSPEPLRRNNL